MSKLVNLDDKRSLYDQIAKNLDSNNFFLVYYRQDGTMGVMQGTETSNVDMAMFQSISDYATSVCMEHMFLNSHEVE